MIPPDLYSIFITKKYYIYSIFSLIPALVQVPNLKNNRLPAIFLLKSRFSFTLPLGFLLVLAKGILKEV